MRIDTQTSRAPTGTMPEHVFGARAALWVPIVARVLATTTAILLASGLAVVMNLS